MSSPGVLFDVDGTLVDSNYLHTVAWSRALEDVGEWAPMNSIHRLIGMGGDQLLPQLIGHECPEAESARSRRYGELIDGVRPFRRANALVAAVHDQGLITALATSSPPDELDHLLGNVLDIDPVLDAKTAASDVALSKPDPEVFLTAMRVGGLDRTRTLAIGDSVWDVEAARNAGIGCIAVESGGFSRHELNEAGALHVYRDVAQILDELLTSPLALLVD